VIACLCWKCEARMSGSSFSAIVRGSAVMGVSGQGMDSTKLCARLVN
jgi:hypothetical protein